MDTRATSFLNDGAIGRGPITHHWELDVYRLGMELAVEIFQETKVWPAEEKFSLTDQIRRSSRSVTAQLAEGWRKRRYQAAFVSKLNDSEGEAAETQNWIEHAVRCGYLDRERGLDLHGRYNHVLGKLVTMQNKPEPWLLQARRE